MFLLLITVTCIKLAASIELAPGQPVRHAVELHRMLNKLLTANIQNYTGTASGSLFGYLFNNTTGPNNNTNNLKNLNINILDASNIKKIVQVAREKYVRQNEEEFRRRRESLHDLPKVIELCMKLMQQSIYTTRFRLLATRPYRKRFKEMESYNIAIFVGSINQILLKMENLHAITERLQSVRTHFLWFLIIYEKLIAGNVDVTYMVKQIFGLHDEYLKKLNKDD